METGKKEIYCNCCGKKLLVEKTGEREDYLFVSKEWGYFSGKDGEIHHFRICEACYDRCTAQFAVPVCVKEQTELF